MLQVGDFFWKLVLFSHDRVMGISRSLGLTISFILPIVKAMNLGLLFLESISTGVITSEEMEWVTCHQREFSRTEAATALRLGRLLDGGTINLGCRI